MPPISMKKVIVGILIIIGLSRLDVLSAFLSRIYESIHDSLDPIHFSADEKYILVLLLGALLYISIYKLLYEKMKK